MQFVLKMQRNFTKVTFHYSYLWVESECVIDINEIQIYVELF